MTTLSVIIPMYNASEYIDDAINSILVQENISIEIIVVDDGSTDDSLNRLNKYNNLKIYSKENGGAASARNFGLTKACGKYVMFLDADDYISSNNICHECINILESHNLDIILFSFKYFNQKTQKYTIPWVYPQMAETILNGHELILSLISHGIFLASPCFRIMRKNFLIENDITFREGYIAEDIDWFIKTIINTTKIKIINDNSYIYRKAISSSVTNQTTILKCQNLLTSINESILMINKCNNQQLKNGLYSAIAYEYCILMSNIYAINKFDAFYEDLKSLKYLMNYTLFPGIKYIKYITSIIGVRYTAKLLYLYNKYFSRSNRE